LVPTDRSRSGPNIFIVPGYTGGAWPGQPDVDWNGGPQWKLVIDRPHDLPDLVKCSYLPPRTGNVMKILFYVEYGYQMPAVTKPMWQELTTTVVSRYGAEAVIKTEPLR
jgi:hypothetical protein